MSDNLYSNYIIKKEEEEEVMENIKFKELINPIKKFLKYWIKWFVIVLFIQIFCFSLLLPLFLQVPPLNTDYTLNGILIYYYVGFLLSLLASWMVAFNQYK